MSKKLTLLLVAALLLVLPAAIYAKRPGEITATLKDLQYADLGITSAKPAKDGVTVLTRGLKATATIACMGNEACVAAGLEGRRLGMRQIMRMNTDHTSAGIVAEVSGRSGAELVFLDAEGAPTSKRIRFQGRLEGTSFRADTAGLHDEVGPLGWVGKTQSGGTLTMQMSGTLVVEDGAVQWQDFGVTDGTAVVLEWNGVDIPPVGGKGQPYPTPEAK